MDKVDKMNKKWTINGQKSGQKREKLKRKLTKWIKIEQKRTKDGHWIKSGKKI